MRVIAGKYKGKRLIAPEGRGTRPTSEKVRESIFDILSSKGHTEGKILDLFAGTGALGIEALSRGASEAVFVEKNPGAAATARKNLASLGITNARVYNTDWKVAVRKLEGRQFDIIFLDPPYADREENAVITAISEKNILAPDGCMVIEHAADNLFSHRGYDADRRRYSDTGVTFLTRSKTDRCIYPGTFDPFTEGHLDIVKKALGQFDAVTVAIAEITYKNDVRPAAVRKGIAELSLNGFSKVDVEIFDGMLTDYLKKSGCLKVVRGIRNDEDRRHEEEIAAIYREAEPEIEIVYYNADHPAISSHEVREMTATGNMNGLKKYVCPGALDKIIEIYGQHTKE